MSAIRTVCPHCTFPVDLDPTEILLIAAPTAAGSGSYAFYCHACEQVTVARVSDRAFAVLSTAGVRVGGGHPEPAPPTGAPGFTVDDLIDFHRLLDSQDWFTQLQRHS